MKLEKRYAIGYLVQFYEIEMFVDDCVNGLRNMLDGIDNPANITLDFVFDIREDFERVDDEKINNDTIIDRFLNSIFQLKRDFNVNITHDILKEQNGDPKAIAWYRRDFNYRYADVVDFLMWGETDSFFPKETFGALEQLSEYTMKNDIHRYVVSFAYRKMWDAGWKILEHPEFTNVEYEETEEWNLRNPASEKCYMSCEQMNQLNERYTKNGFDITQLTEPKFDGSCLVISSEMVKAGINIPHALLMSGEDTSFGVNAKKILGDGYRQFHISNVLRVHNRRHVKKRLYIKGENNPQGFCGISDKGKWWKVLETMSKENLYNLDNPRFKFHTWKDFFKVI